MTGLNDKLDLFRHDVRLRNLDSLAEMARLQEKTMRTKLLADAEMEGKVVRATVDNYKRWLAGYMRRGGNLTHTYDYDFKTAKFLLAVGDFKLLALYGAYSVNVIVPAGIKVGGSDLGHNNLYLMDDFMLRGHWVPIFKDVVFGKETRSK